MGGTANQRQKTQSGQSHAHVHGFIDPTVFTTERGISAVQWSFAALVATAVFQVFIYALTGSVALLADTIHNFGDAVTAIPLWVAFVLARRPASKRFTYGYGRMEDLAGVLIVMVILASAVFAGYEAFCRLYDPRPVSHLWAVMLAAVVGFAGNEAVAQYRIKVGTEISSAALVAEGYHARVDGLTSLAVLVGAVGVWLGYPMTDPVIGMLITAAILRIVWQSGRSVFIRLLDGVSPDVVDEIRHTAFHTDAVEDVSNVRVRWLGHRMHAEVNIAVRSDLSVGEGHRIAVEVRHCLMHHLPYLSDVSVHVDTTAQSGDAFHRVDGHEHGESPPRFHE